MSEPRGRDVLETLIVEWRARAVANDRPYHCPENAVATTIRICANELEQALRAARSPMEGLAVEVDGLRPCPFCGAEAFEWTDAAVVECTKCDAEQHGANPEGAVAAWNRRTPPESAVESQPTQKRAIEGWASLDPRGDEDGWIFDACEVVGRGWPRATLIIHDSESQPARSPEQMMDAAQFIEHIAPFFHRSIDRDEWVAKATAELIYFMRPGSPERASAEPERDGRSVSTERQGDERTGDKDNRARLEDPAGETRPERGDLLESRQPAPSVTPASETWGSVRLQREIEALKERVDLGLPSMLGEPEPLL